MTDLTIVMFICLLYCLSLFVSFPIFYWLQRIRPKMCESKLCIPYNILYVVIRILLGLLLFPIVIIFVLIGLLYNFIWLMPIEVFNGAKEVEDYIKDMYKIKVMDIISFIEKHPPEGK